MSVNPSEVTTPNIQLLKCTLEVENSRAYWSHHPRNEPVDPETAFTECWFGGRSMSRVKLLVRNFRTRFDAYPKGMKVLMEWQQMSPAARQLICHWHLQLADPLYRAFTGGCLVQRRLGHRQTFTRDLAVKWLEVNGPDRWTLATRTEYASKLLTASYQSGLIASRRDPRRVTTPHVPGDALGYVLHLLRGVTFAGTLADNPYLLSVGLDSAQLADRLRPLPYVRYLRQGGAATFEWQYPGIEAWAQAELGLDQGGAQ